jgi:hypothetical protein
MTHPPDLPPPPPETPPLLPVADPSLPDDAAVLPAPHAALMPEIGAAPLPGENMPIAPLALPKGGFRGCMGCLGVIGAMALIILILGIGAIVVSIQAAGSVGAGISNAFNGAGNFVSSLLGAASSPRIITLPEIDRIKQLAQLTTIRFNYANVVSSQTEMPSLLAGLYGESLVMVAVGHVEAGIQLEALTDEAFAYNETDDVLLLRLPAPTLLNCFLNENQSYVVERSSGVLAAPSPTLDTTSRRFAVAQFRAKALEDGILAQAQTEAEIVIGEFVSLFMATTNPTIQITFAPPDPTAPLPETCQ